ncbi:MAG TPA: Ig-like domain-containing protein [Chitinophagaceae bacterium]|nr:Ig-like domain-containing protein [Chitinophagaceae bacterium]
MKKFTLFAVFILLALTAFCQPKKHDCPRFKRNNGGNFPQGPGTCGGDAQIRVYWDDCSAAVPRLDSIYYQGKKITGITFGAPDQSDCAKKGYTSYCIYGHNIPPAKKLTLYFTYPDGFNNSCEVEEGPITNPDINVTYVNVPVPGNVSTNDVVPPGTMYGTPVLTSKPSGSTETITLNSDGTYNFVANTPGVYTYNVPVCAPGQITGCETSLLTITVLQKTSNNNPPVANTDIATTKINTAVTIKSLANDRAGNPGGSLNPASVTVIDNPDHGTATVDLSTGNIIYTPAAGFTGNDTLRYRVCDNSTTPLCATALQIITVYAQNNNDNTTSAADDYATTPMNTAVSGNVKTNDTDAEGNAQTVTPQTTTVSGKGTLVLNANGTYTFTPVSGFTGPVSFVYTTCDNGTPQACANATLYLMVTPGVTPGAPDLTPRINLNPNNVIGTSRVEVTVQINELNNIPTNGSLITLYVDKLTSFTNFSFNPTQTTNQAGQPIQNSLFTVDAVSNPNYYVITTNAVFQNGALRLSFYVDEVPGQTKGSTPVNVYLVNGSGGETNFTNNTSFTTLTFSF